MAHLHHRGVKNETTGPKKAIAVTETDKLVHEAMEKSQQLAVLCQYESDTQVFDCFSKRSTAERLR